MRLNIFNSLIGLCVATAAVSCSDALVDDVNMRPVGGEDSDMISFVVANTNTTRGGSFGNRPCGGAFLRNSNGTDSLYMKAEVADINDDLLTRAEEYGTINIPSSLKMTCRIIKGANDYYHYFANVEYNLNGGIWASSTPYYWMSLDTNYNFFGYAPADAIAEGDFHANNNSDYIPTIDYTVPSTMADQYDLMYHSGGSQKYINTNNQAAPLSMKHALAKVAFKVKGLPSGKEIESISINNVNNGGTLNLGTGIWTLKSTGSYITNSWLKEGDEPIIGDNCFTVLPGVLTDAVQVSVKVKNEKNPYTYPIKGVTNSWEAGQAYIYILDMGPDFTITVDEDSKTVDAHYVIATATVNAEPGVDWNIKVDVTDQSGSEVNADVTVVREGNETFKDYVKYYKEGYWLDKIANNGVLSEDTARGYATEQGTGEEKLYIFIPENLSDGNYTINIKNAKSDEVLKTITQRHPAWSSSDPNFGWEQLEETGTAQWGFYSSETRVYVYNNSHLNVWPTYYLDKIEAMIKNLIVQFNADQYVTYKQYWAGNGYRYWVKIDYSSFSNLIDSKTNQAIANSTTNGLQNIKDLNSFAGSAYTRAFEEALLACVRVQDTSAKAFRERKSNDPSDVPNDKIDKEIVNPMLPHILKKNRYNLNKIVEGSGETAFQTMAPAIGEIQWYLPAYGEFDKEPSTVDNSIYRDLSWSSTAVNNSTDAYIGSSAPTPKIRKDNNRIRVCRKR